MNPSKLSKRLVFNDFTIWGERIIKNKGRESGQNNESYEFIIRKREIDEYVYFVCDDISYIVLTIDSHEKGYLKLTCEKSKIHTFYDIMNVSRMVDIVGSNGADKSELQMLYENIPCEIVRLASATANESEQENATIQNYDLYCMNDVDLKVGDSIFVTHKDQIIDVTTIDVFKTHTHQVASLRIESEA